MDFKTGLGATTLSVPEVAAFLNGTTKWVHKLIDSGDLEAFKISGKWYVHRASVERLLKEQQAIPPTDRALQLEVRDRRHERNLAGKSRQAVAQISLLPED